MKIFKDNVLNTVSHYDVSSPIYGNEILSIMKILSKLDQIRLNKNQIDVNSKLGIELTADNGQPVTICIDIRSKKINILEYNGNQNVSYYTKCVVYKIIKNGTPMDINPEVTYDSIYEAYWYYIGRYGCDSTINLLDVIKDHGVFIKDKL